MRLRKFVGGAVVIAAIALFSGCHADVAAFRATVHEDELEHGLTLRDETRRPHEEEAQVSGATDELPRFRIDAIPSDAGDLPVRMLELELAGDFRGGQVEISGPIVYSAPFSRAVVVADGSVWARSNSGGNAIDGSTILRFDLTTGATSLTVNDLQEAEIVFSAADDREYSIEALRFLSEPAELRVAFPVVSEDRGTSETSSVPRFDDRLPVSIDPTSREFPDLSALLSGDLDGVRLVYHMPRSAFEDRTARPVATLELRGAGGARRTLQLYVRPGTREVILRPDLWEIDADALTVRDAPEGFQLRELSGTGVPPDPEAPIPIEMSELLRYPADQWRRDEFELFTWTLYPDILWFDTRDYEVQARLFRRLAFFVEKRGFIGSLLTDEALAGRHGWNAHNYRPEGLADFFNAVRSTDFPLNEYEEQLREIILERGIITEDDSGRFLPGRGGVLSVSQSSSIELRRLLITHEAMHGIFYQEPTFRRGAFDYWDNVLDPRERGFWQDFFSWMSYSPDDRYLMVNEFQAYLLQQSEAGVRWYFRSRTADRLRNAYPQRIEQIDIFLRDYPSTFVDAGAAMNQALFEAAGMVGGDPYELQPLAEE